MKKYIIALFLLCVVVSSVRAEDYYVSSKNPNHKLPIMVIDQNHMIGAQIDENQYISYSARFPQVCLINHHYYLHGRCVDSQMDSLAEQSYAQGYEPTRQPTEQDRAINNIIIIAILIALILGIVGIFKGVKNKVVFFLNWPEAILTLIWVVLIIIIKLEIQSHVPSVTDFMRHWGYMIAFPLSIIGMGYITYKYNKGIATAFDMVCVLIAKCFLSVIGSLILISMCFGGPSYKKEDKDFDKFMSVAGYLAVLGAFGWLIIRLVNGEEVRKDLEFDSFKHKLGM